MLNLLHLSKRNYNTAWRFTTASYGPGASVLDCVEPHRSGHVAGQYGYPDHSESSRDE